MELVEVVSPRTNTATYTALEHFFAAVVRTGGVSLERAEMYRSRQSPGGGSVGLAVLFLVAVVALPRLWGLYLASGWLAVGAVAIPAVALVAALFVVWARLTRRPLYDLELVKEKLAQ